MAAEYFGTEVCVHYLFAMKKYREKKNASRYMKEMPLSVIVPSLAS
jgi:hypothetical protein